MPYLFIFGGIAFVAWFVWAVYGIIKHPIDFKLSEHNDEEPVDSSWFNLH